jgi:4a-hydroxytetrahydrobiopterin dehydratase
MPARRASKRGAARAKPARKAASARPRKVPIEVPEGWSVQRGGKRIARALETEDFVQAVDVINEIRDAAEELEHHPDVHLEKWNQLRIVTYSHDVGHLTDRDQRLAERINAILAKRGLA